MDTIEKLMVNYNHKLDYAANVINGIGPLTSTTLRSLSIADNGTNTLYVRKFGTPYLVKQVTNIGTVPNNLTFVVKALDGTVLGLKVGGAPFSAGTTLSTAQPCYLLAVWSGNNAATGTSVTITTDAHSSETITIYLSNETITTSNNDVIFYISDTGSTYYDPALMYGGARHTPTGTTRKPYFHIIPALAALATTYVCVTVLDSAIYDGEITISRAFTLQASLGQIPTATCGIGARTSREVVHDGNNTDTAYVSNAGNDSTGTGTWQNPYLTIENARTSAGSRTYINIKDSAQYIIDGSVSLIQNIEPCYGYVPNIIGIQGNSAVILWNNYFINGLVVNGSLLVNIGIDAAVYVSHTASIKNNTIINCASLGINAGYTGFPNDSPITLSTDISYNEIYSNGTGISVVHNSTGSGNIKGNYIHGNSSSGILYQTSKIPGTSDTNIANNLISECSLYGIKIFVRLGTTYTGTVKNNTEVYNNVGVEFDVGGTSSVAVNANISYFNKAYDVVSTSSQTINHSDYGSNSGFTVGTGNQSNDPMFSNVSKDRYGLSSVSPCLKADGSGNDIGCIFDNILISSNNVKINGFYLDGQTTYNNAIAKTGTSNYTGLLVSWCEAKNYNGIAIDDFSGATTTTILNNCKLHDNGDGIKFTNGGNSIIETLIYNNENYGTWSDYVLSLNHCSFALNNYGLWADIHSNVSMKNTITAFNTTYGVYSMIVITPISSDFQDSIFNVNLINNLSFDPLFVSVDPLNLDLHLRTTQAGYIQPSSLIGKADDGYDIGAYKITYSVADDNWNSYTVTYNPKKMTKTNVPKGVSIFEDALGSKDLFMLNMKRQFLWDWEDSVSDSNDRDKLEFFATQQKNRLFNPDSEIVKFRLHLQPTTFMDSGLSAVVNASTLTIGDSSKTWVENKHRGFHVGIKFLKGISLVINATALTATDSTASWTVNQWTGYFLYISGNYFVVVSNTSTVLTLSDYYGQLVNGTLATYSLEKYFKINSNTLNVLNVDDPNSELPTGNYDYYIDFIEVRVIEPTFTVVQDPFTMARPHAQGQYTLSMEEI